LFQYLRLPDLPPQFHASEWLAVRLYRFRVIATTEGHMCLATLHDKVRNLGLGMMYEKHWGDSGFRDLFDEHSREWRSTSMPEKIVHLKAFQSAGVSTDELINHYRETYTQQGDPGHVLDSLPATMRAYRDAGYWPTLPDDLDAEIARHGGGWPMH
jgi:hypothetical protein